MDYMPYEKAGQKYEKPGSLHSFLFRYYLFQSRNRLIFAINKIFYFNEIY